MNLVKRCLIIEYTKFFQIEEKSNGYEIRFDHWHLENIDTVFSNSFKDIRTSWHILFDVLTQRELKYTIDNDSIMESFIFSEKEEAVGAIVVLSLLIYYSIHFSMDVKLCCGKAIEDYEEELKYARDIKFQGQTFNN